MNDDNTTQTQEEVTQEQVTENTQENTEVSEDTKEQLIIAIQLSETDWDNLIDLLGDLPAKQSMKYISHFMQMKSTSIAQYKAEQEKASNEPDVAQGDTPMPTEVEATEK